MAHYKGAASEAGRAMQLMKKREKEMQDLELRKKRIEEDLKLNNIENKFATHYDAVEQQLKSSTIGLVTLDEMKAKQENIVKEREKKLAQKQAEKEREKQRQMEAKQAEKNKQKKQIQALSFNLEDEEGEENDDDDDENEQEQVIVKASNFKRPKEEIDSSNLKKVRKNPNVDTSFLPDREREEEENKLREELRQEWAEQQEKLKEEEIDITFSYWDGSGHRRTVRVKKGNSIYQFLQKVLEVLRREFSELKTVMADQLMYVKEDLILPHHYTFYDFIVTKARGKSGPLFQFDVHDDIRLLSDASIEKEDSHAGKVLLRSWYERNKHIFPASRWEPYDPTKSYDKYTVSDKNKKS
ncbi:protein FAM50 homolog [Diabrotica virgifera virgifera]|uniref:Protein FAM50 homolog n=1 Tax=Diabrotica virgifera virgifera TaxID=50390 RepID=A0A6P7H1N2_DIAVI|nr:protein FAM50 homolog [Diabrotica virgifera virgifera]